VTVTRSAVDVGKLDVAAGLESASTGSHYDLRPQTSRQFGPLLTWAGDDQVSGLVWSGMSGIGWMIAVSSQPDGLVQTPAPSFGCREVAHQHTHACNPGRST
jgi:hypothetical protein